MTAQLQAPAIGYRGFHWDGSGPLKSTGVESCWPIMRDPQHARCIATTAARHPAPQEDCTCGLHAYSTPEAVTGQVGAVVLGYDSLIVHPDGWRAATVGIAALVCIPPDRDTVRLVFRLNGPTEAHSLEAPSRDALSMLADAYGVPLVDDWEHGTALAQEQGAQPVPEILHAEAEAWAKPTFLEAGITMAFTASTANLAAAMQRMSEAISAASVSINDMRAFSFAWPEPAKPAPKRRERRFDTPRQRHAAFNAELARRSRPRALR